jgi:membrane protein
MPIRSPHLWASCRHVVRRTATEWTSDNATRWSASVAFYTLLSLAPLLVVTVTIAGYAYGRNDAQGELGAGLRNLVGPDVAPGIQTLLTSPRKPLSGFIAVVFGTLTLLFGASSILTELRDALNAMWHVPVQRSGSHLGTVWRLGKERIYSFAMIIGLGALLLISLVLSTWIGAIEKVLGLQTLASGYFVHASTFLLSGLLIAFVFAAVYKLIPKVRLDWREVTIGGAVTSLLFILGKQLIALYMARVNLGSAYGAAGSLLVVLVWVYYSAQVFFFGAEFTKVYAETFGSQKDHRKGSERSACGETG